jgi:tetratricopeptide (TPR) repeat protein
MWCGALALEGAAVALALGLLGVLPQGAMTTSMRTLAPGGTLAAWGVAVALHAGASLLLLLPGPFFRDFYRLRSTVCGLAAAVGFAMPGIGLAGCVFARGCANLLMRRKNKTAQFRQAVDMSLGEDNHWISRKRVGQVLADEIAIEPVVDVLAGDDPDLKRGAVKLLQRMGTPGAVALLRSCMSDPFPEVRFYAHSALSELEDAYAQRIKTLREQLESAPEAALWRSLGREYSLYAESGLVDEVMRRQTLEESRKALAQALALEPEHALALLLSARVLLQLGEMDAARAQFEHCQNHEDVASEARLGLAQIAFEQRDMRALAMQARAMAESAAPRPHNADSLELYEFWSKADGVRHA